MRDREREKGGRRMDKGDGIKRGNWRKRGDVGWGGRERLKKR